MGGGSFTQEEPFELSLECKKRKKKDIPGRINSLYKGVNIHNLFGAKGGLLLLLLLSHFSRVRLRATP